MAIADRKTHKPFSCLPDMAVIGSQVYTTSTVCRTRSVQPRSLMHRTSLPNLAKKRFPRRSAVPCANSSGNVYLTPTYDAACNLTISRALCGVKEKTLSVCDTLLLQLVHIQRANTATAVLKVHSKVLATVPFELLHHFFGYNICNSHVV